MFQLQYKAELKFLRLLVPTAERLVDIYPDWEADQTSVTLKNFEKHCSLAIQHNSLLYEQDSEDFETEDRFIQHILKEVPSTLEIEVFSGFGYRRQYLVPVNLSFEALIKVMKVKLLSMDGYLSEVLSEKVGDLMYRLKFIDQEFQYNLTVAPVKKEEILSQIIYNRNNHLNPTTAIEDFQIIFEEYPSVAILIDIDFYRPNETISVRDIRNSLELAREKTSNLTSGITKHLLKQSL